MALGKSLNLSVFLYLSGVKNMILVISVGDWWCMCSQPCFEDAVLCDRALLLHLCFSASLQNYSVTGSAVFSAVFLYKLEIYF